MSTQRLQKIIAQAGVASRRKAEELITQGRVTVNGQVVKTLGAKADPDQDKVAVDGKILVASQEKLVYMLNKPENVVTTTRDPGGRKTVFDFLPKGPRVFPIGRLDRMTEGLLLLTNDGDLALKLSHPRFGHRKIYEVTLASSRPIDTLVASLKKGVNLDGHHFQPDAVDLAGIRDGRPIIRLTVHEGRTHLIRKLCGRLGFEVLRLRRVQIGSLALGDLKSGEIRSLSAMEMEMLRESVGQSVDERSAPANPNVAQ